jgi:tRNA threonylcarbamoyladenosine biosynthesis protein TsaE
MKINVENEKKLADLAKKISLYIKPGDILLLTGEMGAGKTTFTRYLLGFFNNKENVSSPTFTIINKYYCDSVLVFHIDLYRLDFVEDLLNIDIQSYLDRKDAIVIIEWAEKLQELMPNSYLEIQFRYPEYCVSNKSAKIDLQNELGKSRDICIFPKGKRYNSIYKSLML